METPADFADKVHLLLEAGANIIGGCCGTTPEHIRKLAPLVKAWRHNG
jgi:5-methyltetrahydrofolate--homocysteine methyltransferase